MSFRRLPLFSQAEFFDRRGAAYQAVGQFKNARADYLKAVSLYRKSKDNPAAAQVSLHVGDLDRQLENFSSATAWYEQAQKWAGRGFVQLAVDAACGKALCLRVQGRFELADRWFRDLLTRYQKLKDKEGQAYMHWALGTTQRFLGRLGEAEKNLQKSLSLYRVIQDPSGEAYALCGLGGTLRMRGRAQNSGQAYKKAQRFFSQHKDLFGLAYSYCGQANAARMQNKFAQARPLFGKAMTLYRRLKQKGPLGFVLWSLAQQEICQGQLAQAKRHLQEAEKLFRSVQDERGLVYVNLGWGEYNFKIRRDSSARFYRSAIRLAKKMKLALESVHALRAVSNVNPYPLYRALGVHLPSFMRYKTLP